MTGDSGDVSGAMVKTVEQNWALLTDSPQVATMADVGNVKCLWAACFKD